MPQTTAITYVNHIFRRWKKFDVNPAAVTGNFIINNPFPFYIAQIKCDFHKTLDSATQLTGRLNIIGTATRFTKYAPEFVFLDMEPRFIMPYGISPVRFCLEPPNDMILHAAGINHTFSYNDFYATAINPLSIIIAEFEKEVSIL